MQPNPRTSPAERLAAERKATTPSPEHAAGWTAERIELLSKLWTDGKSASECAAALGGGVSRSGIIGKVHRLKLVQGGKKKPRLSRRATSRNKGQPKAARLVERAQAKRVATDIAAARESGLKRSDAIQMVVGRLEKYVVGTSRVSLGPEDGVDVTHLCGIMDLTQQTCRWPVSGEGPLTMFCGEGVRDGSPYCGRHHRRAHAGTANLDV